MRRVRRMKDHVIIRAEGRSTTAKMYRAGADHVVSPNKTGAVWVASLLVRPSVASLNVQWALTDSNRRPPACKAGALNQLS